MKNVVLSIVVIAALVAAGIGGTFAGFVDTEVSPGNFIQAGISDLLVNGENDPNVPAKIWFDHVTPSKSIDFWADLYNWGKCQGGDVYLHVKDVISVEAGYKTHEGTNYVYNGDYIVGTDPTGAGVATSEPELGAEEGDFYIGQMWIPFDDPALMGVDYASGIADHLGLVVTVPLKGATGNELGNPDTNGDGDVDAAERAAWETDGNRWKIITELSGKLVDIECTKVYLGFLRTQEMTFVHFDVELQQIEDSLWDTDGDTVGEQDYDQDGDVDADDAQMRWWPTNALQGDYAMWDMLFELTTDP
jgi:hypothetical protein